MDSAVFRGCTGLRAILVPAENTRFRSENGILFSADMTELIAYPAGLTGSIFTVPDGVRTIQKGAFSGCANLMRIALPASLTTICQTAFSDCTGLLRIVIPDSVGVISLNAFQNCSSLAEVVMGSGVTEVQQYAFYNCTSLTSFTFGSSVAQIGMRVFEGCTALSTVRFTGGVPAFNAECFRNMNLTAYYPALDAGWTGDVLQGYGGTVTWIGSFPEPTFFLPADLTGIESEAFSGISAVAVMIPRSVNDIIGNPFAGSSVQVIYGFPGTAAEALADSFGYAFREIDDSWLATHGR